SFTVESMTNPRHLNPPSPHPFPYTTLFRSRPPRRDVGRLGVKSDRVGAVQRAGPGGCGRLPFELGRQPCLRPSCVRASLVKAQVDRKSTRLNSSHLVISYAVFCLKKQYI